MMQTKSSNVLVHNEEIDSIPLKAVSEFGAPLYLYDFELIKSKYLGLSDILPPNFCLHYALKANSNIAIANLIASQGSAVEASSLGEIIAALKAGFSAESIVFTGPGKTNVELTSAIELNVGLIVVESFNEAVKLAKILADYDKTQKVILRINPQFRTSKSCDLGTVRPIDMNGMGLSKFGIDESQAFNEIMKISELSKISFLGIHIFTESNVLDYTQLLAAWQNSLLIAHRLKDLGCNIEIVDFGGGIGVPYNSVDSEFDISEFGEALHRLFGDEPFKFILEMGRYIVCEAGMYVSEILDIKESQGSRVVIVNGGVHHLYRTPAMQDASKFLRVLGKESSETMPTTLAGQLPTPIDIIVRDAEVAIDLQIGDYIVIKNCGAYGFNHSLANFVLHPSPAEVAIFAGKLELIRTRGNYEDFFTHQRLLPNSLASK